MPNPIVVGWCPSCEVVYDPYPGPRTPCEGEDLGKDTPYYQHRIHKRRMWKCSHEDCYELISPTYFLTRAELTEHEAALVAPDDGESPDQAYDPRKDG